MVDREPWAPGFLPQSGIWKKLIMKLRGRVVLGGFGGKAGRKAGKQ